MSELYDLPEATEIRDPYVTVYLAGGNTIEMQDVSILELSNKIMQHGYAYMGDGRGTYLFLFRHGVTAITASNEPYKARH